MKNFTPKNYKWSVKGLEKCIAENGMKSEIIYVTPSAAIVKVDNYEDSVVLGAVTDWCICQHSCSWKQYVADKPNNIQIFFYNFGLPYEDYLSVVGATFEITDTKSIVLRHCFSRENKPIREKLYKCDDDLHALNELIIRKNFCYGSAISILIDAGITDYYQYQSSTDKNDDELLKKWDAYNNDCMETVKTISKDGNVYIPNGYAYTPIYVDYDWLDDYDV
jgi:hypothetical protein